MPTLSTPTLTLGNTNNNKRNVTVAGNITFDAGDVGKTYRLELHVYGEDGASDTLPSGDSTRDDLVYSYRFGGALPVKYKSIAVVAAGNFAYSELRAVEVEKLDEDPGSVVHIVAGQPISMPRKDELYARATLTSAPVSKRSTTVVSPFGV